MASSKRMMPQCGVESDGYVRVMKLDEDSQDACNTLGSFLSYSVVFKIISYPI
jgi:hypothetical protein